MNQWQQLGDKYMEFITVERAEQIIQSHARHFGVEEVFYEKALGRILAENLFADRDLPPFNRPTVDGIAINFDAYKKGVRSFKVCAIQSAGEIPIPIANYDECVEIMTGAALDPSVDTVVRYEDLEIVNGIATIKDIEIKEGQHIHFKGQDKKGGDILASANSIITPALIGLAASVGKIKLLVKKMPNVVVISTGDEMIPAEATPTPYQLRRSNGVTIKAVLENYKINSNLLHLNDDIELINTQLSNCLKSYDVLLICGGVSKGKFDFVPQVLENLGVKKLFHTVKQRPGKPFWFGTHNNQQLIFAFPGNPVSAFMCLHKYFIPWLQTSLGITLLNEYAILQSNISFHYPLQYFAQVKLSMSLAGELLAEYVEGNGSGDFSNLVHTDAFIELPLEKTVFKKGEAYKIWKYSF